MSMLVFYFYKFVIVPLAYFLLQLCRPFLNGKLREMIEDKNQGFYHIKKAHSENEIALARPFWIHAASGEIEYARPVIRELKKQHPDIPILVTYSSPSAKKILTGLHEVDVWAALPWDLDFLIAKFIKKWNPRILLFSRTDVWPVLASVAKKQNLPTALFSATFADNSSRLKGITRYLTRFALSHLSEIHCVSAEDIQNLESLHLKVPVMASGDTRFDQVFHRLENPKALKSELIPSPEDFIFIAGSTWPEDEAVLLPALEKLKALHMQVIIAPHETTSEHLDSLEKKMHDLGLRFVRYSQAQVWPAGSILIVDQVGILAELYTWADIAFVGGSFKKQVHSVMEALAAGLPVLVGPFHRNNREALFYQKKNFSSGMIVQVVHSAEDIAVLLQRMKKHQEQIPHIKEEIRAEIGKNRNSTLRVLSSIEKVLQ
ncbi:3-deoxy-D-manno-octulosonic acid transferase [Bdellovibrio sp. HCB-162]|uniref:3-deoxy-D-manno-octulosonic acid transferase n=1 Tax=Bdellovibrio sp. HCB-162 TaxID=3394234 RepID=UPI0039BC4847